MTHHLRHPPTVKRGCAHSRPAACTYSHHHTPDRSRRQRRTASQWRGPSDPTASSAAGAEGGVGKVEVSECKHDRTCMHPQHTCWLVLSRHGSDSALLRNGDSIDFPLDTMYNPNRWLCTKARVMRQPNTRAQAAASPYRSMPRPDMASRVVLLWRVHASWSSASFSLGSTLPSKKAFTKAADLVFTVRMVSVRPCSPGMHRELERTRSHSPLHLQRGTYVFEQSGHRRFVGQRGVADVPVVRNLQRHLNESIRADTKSEGRRQRECQTTHQVRRAACMHIHPPRTHIAHTAHTYRLTKPLP